MTELATDSRGNTLHAYRWGRRHAPLEIGDKPSVSEPIGEHVSVVYVLATADFRFSTGKAPVATNASPRLPANALIPLRVFGGERISVVQFGDEVGEVEITEME